MTSVIYKFTNNNYDGLYFLKEQIISSNLIDEVFVMEKCSFRKGPRQSTFNFGNKEILFLFIPLILKLFKAKVECVYCIWPFRL